MARTNLAPPMSAIGPKQTLAGALHMSAFGGKADIAIGVGGQQYRGPGPLYI
jgi:hypothetical protein